MTPEDIEAIETRWRRALIHMKNEGVISSQQFKGLNTKIKVWCYDKTHEGGEDRDT
ncbi:hypothetical protein D3C71_2234440 [compost metagenome]